MCERTCQLPYNFPFWLLLILKMQCCNTRETLTLTQTHTQKTHIILYSGMLVQLINTMQKRATNCQTCRYAISLITLTLCPQLCHVLCMLQSINRYVLERNKLSVFGGFQVLNGVFKCTVNC